MSQRESDVCRNEGGPSADLIMHAGDGPFWKGQVTAAPQPSTHHDCLTPTLGKEKLKSWGCSSAADLTGHGRSAVLTLKRQSVQPIHPEQLSELRSLSQSVKPQGKSTTAHFFTSCLHAQSSCASPPREHEDSSSPAQQLCSSASVLDSPIKKLNSTALPGTRASAALGPKALIEEQHSSALPANCAESPLWTFCSTYSCDSSSVANRLSPGLLSSLGPEAPFKKQPSPALQSMCIGEPWGSPLRPVELRQLTGRKPDQPSPTEQPRAWRTVRHTISAQPCQARVLAHSGAPITTGGAASAHQSPTGSAHSCSAAWDLMHCSRRCGAQPRRAIMLAHLHGPFAARGAELACPLLTGKVRT